jgi:hypothetical protein
MNAFLNSIRADLLDRRLRAVLLLVAAALVGALAYALTGGSGSAGAPPPIAPPVISAGSGIAPVAVGASPGKAVAETTSGSSDQRGGSSRDPFTPLPGSAAPPTSASSAGKSSSSSSSANTSKSTSTTSAPATPPASHKPAAPAKPKPVYRVAVLFGEIPAGTLPQNAHLTPHQHLKAQQTLPSKQNQILSFKGVEAGGKRASFKLVGEALLRGPALCLPSASQCQEIALSQGQIEELEYLPHSGPAVVYELQLVSITPTAASAAAVRGLRVRIAHGAAVVEPVAVGELWRRHLARKPRPGAGKSGSA